MRKKETNSQPLPVTFPQSPNSRRLGFNSIFPHFEKLLSVRKKLKRMLNRATIQQFVQTN